MTKNLPITDLLGYLTVFGAIIFTMISLYLINFVYGVFYSSLLVLFIISLISEERRDDSS